MKINIIGIWERGIYILKMGGHLWVGHLSLDGFGIDGLNGWGSYFKNCKEFITIRVCNSHICVMLPSVVQYEV